MDHIKMCPATFFKSSIIYLMEHTLPFHVSWCYGLSEVKARMCNIAYWERKYRRTICNCRVSNVNNSAGAKEAWSLLYT